MSIYTRVWSQLRSRAKPGAVIGRVSHVVGHTEAGAPLPASATVDQEVARFRAIDAFHQSLGWAGFGYSTMVCQSGRLYEGRGYRRAGAHTQGHNTTALAFVVPGHGDRTPMSPAAIRAARVWIGEGVRVGAIVSDPRVTGHRDHASKSCPGNLIYPQLAQVRGVRAAEEAPPMGTVAAAFKGHWDKMVRARIFTEHTNPKATPTNEQVAAYFDRAGIPDIVEAGGPAAVAHAADLKRHMDSRGSNAGYVAGVIDLIRAPALTRAQGDERYAPRGAAAGGSGGVTVEQARAVAREEVGRARVTPGS